MDGADLSEFAARWNLDAQAIEYLGSLDDHVRLTILSEFAPRDNTHDVAGKLYAFARSIISQQTKTSALNPELEAFAQRWGLDGAAMSWLSQLPPEVSSILVEQFDPKEDTHNIIGKMRGFARSIQARIPAGGAGAGSADTGRHDALTLRTSEFAAKWGLEDSSLGLLKKLPADVQQTVMGQFDPKGDTLNVNGKFCSFARSVAAVRQVQGVAEAFAQHWGLDAGTTQFLLSLPQEVRDIVIQQFDPMAGTRDVGGRLRMFAKGILAKHPQAGGERPVAEPDFHYRGAGREFREAGGAGALSSAIAAGAQEAQTAAASAFDPSVAEFVMRWSLDATCVTFLEALPDDARAKVLDQFDPRGNTRNVSAKLRAFAQTVVSGQGGKGQPALAAVAVERHSAPLPPLQQPQHFVAAAAAPDLSEEAAFLERWGLSANPSALDVLRRLHPPVRALVMRDFAPANNTHDIFGKFCGFAASVAKGASKGGASSLPPLRAPPSHGAGHGAVGVAGEYGGGLSVRSQPPRRAPAAGYMTPEQFAEKWQLDAGSRALLSGLDPDAQATVMVEFQPRDETRDMSGKFCAFARSVASRLQPTGPKRGIGMVGGLSPAGPPAAARRLW